MKSAGNPSRSGSTGMVPCNVSVNPTIWERHVDRLDRLQKQCPDIRIGGRDGGDSAKAVEHKTRDEWGCLWHHPGMYLTGVVVEHPLDTWDKLGDWQPPPVEERVAAIAQRAEEARQAGRTPPGAGFEHGFLFLRLTYLRGFENFMVDVAERNPKLLELRDLVADYWYTVAKAHLDHGGTHVGGGDDLGLQDRLPISPAAWRELLKPAYARIFGLARDRSATVSLHSDGYIVDIIPDLIEIGVTSLNPQDLVNGLENLVRLAKGKVHITLDIDRQSVTVFGTPDEIDAHIRECIRALGSPSGGLSLIWGVYPGTPVASIEAGVRAMQAYRAMWV